MGSIETDELRYDGGNRGATQAQIDMEDADRRREARERVEKRLDDRDQHTLDCVAEQCWREWDEVVRLLSKGRRQEAHDLLDTAVDSAIERVIDAEAA